MNYPLKLYHEVMLLSLHDRDGTIVSPDYLNALATSILCDLILNGNLSLDGDQDQRIGLANNSHVDQLVLNEALTLVHNLSEPRTFLNCVRTIVLFPNLKDRVGQELADQGILETDKKSFLWIVSQKTFPESDSHPEKEVKKRLEKLLFSDDPEFDERTLLLATIANGTSLLEYNFSVKRKFSNQERIDLILENESVGEITRRLLKALSTPEMTELFATMPEV